jgi:energy-coupling factor transporter ATP-binding protein EcfA2
VKRNEAAVAAPHESPKKVDGNATVADLEAAGRLEQALQAALLADSRSQLAEVVGVSEDTAEQLMAWASIQGPQNAARADAATRGRALDLVPFSEIEKAEVLWLWKGRIAMGELNLIYGTEGLGKSTVTVALAAAVSTGSLAGAFEETPAAVAFVTTEDTPETTIRPRLEAAGADLTNVHFVKVTDGQHEDALSLPEDTDMLIAGLTSAGVRLVILDPLIETLGAQVKNAWNDREVRQATAPLRAALKESGIAGLGVLHTNRQSTTNSRSRAGGSIAWRQVARTAAVLGVDPDNPDGDTRVLAFDKNNLGPRARSIRLKVVSKEVSVGDKTASIGAVELGEEVDFPADDLHAAEAGSQRAGDNQLDRAMGMLYDLLEEGPKAVQVIREEAQRRGIGWRTVERAKGEIGVEAEQRGREWFWALRGGSLDV